MSVYDSTSEPCPHTVESLVQLRRRISGLTGKYDGENAAHGERLVVMEEEEEEWREVCEAFCC